MPPSAEKSLKSKRGRKSKVDTVVDIDELDNELRENASTNTNPDLITFFKENGRSESTNEQFYQIQAENSEVGFTPKPIDDYRLNAAKVNPDLDHLFSTTHYNQLPDVELFPISNPNPQLNHNITLSFNETSPHVLQTGSLMNFPYSENNLRTGTILNSGNLPLTMEWCPLEFNGSKFLFVASVDKDADISEYSNTKTTLSIIEYNKDSSLVQVNKNIIVDSLIKELEFSFTFDEEVSLLKLTLSNGSIEIWKINKKLLSKDENSISMYSYYTMNDTSKITFMLNRKNLLISSSCFASSNDICFTTNTGLIGLFDIKMQKTKYIISTRLPSITCVKCSYPDEENFETFDVHISCTDMYSYIGTLPFLYPKHCLVNNIKFEEVALSHKEWTFEKNALYLSTHRAFLTVELSGTIQKTVSRNINETLRLKVLNDGDINCLSNQRFHKNGLQQSGFILASGHTNGSIRLINVFNSTLPHDKKAAFTLKLFQMHQLQDKTFQIDLSYSVDKTGDLPPPKEKTKQLSISRFRAIRTSNDRTITPTRISINENILASCWGNGLIIFEELHY